MIKYVIEYGSHATGEQTSLSDRDILIICNRIKKKNQKEQLENLFHIDNKRNNLDVKILNYKRFKSLLNKGSLFAYHVIFDGKAILGNMKTLQKKYKYNYNYVEDLKSLLKVYSFIKLETNKYGITIYDLSVLYVIIRNFVVIHSYLFSQVIFSKSKIKSYIQKEFANEINGIDDLFENLVQAKYTFNRDLSIKHNKEKMFYVYKQAVQLIEHMREDIKKYENT